MYPETLRSAVAAAALAWFATPAGAVIIDFETLAHDGDNVVHVTSHEEDGFRITSNIDPILEGMAFSVWGSTAEDYNGSTALFNTYMGSVTTLTKVDGGTFDFTGLLLGPLIANLAGSVTFIGRTTSGAAVSRTFDFGPALVPQQVWFGTDFSGLASVSWEQESATQAHQFDDIRLNEQAPIPEPRTTALVIGGLGLVSLMSMRRRQARRVAVSASLLRA
jgi:hypothetical protein